MSSASGAARRGNVLGLLTRLEQICNHPDQYLGQSGFAEADSGKGVQEAAEKADALKKTAAAEAEAAFEKAVNETNKKAAERVAAAEKKAEAFVEEAVKKVTRTP